MEFSTCDICHTAFKSFGFQAISDFRVLDELCSTCITIISSKKNRFLFSRITKCGNLTLSYLQILIPSLSATNLTIYLTEKTDTLNCLFSMKISQPTYLHLHLLLCLLCYKYRSFPNSYLQSYPLVSRTLLLQLFPFIHIFLPLFQTILI